MNADKKLAMKMQLAAQRANIRIAVEMTCAELMAAQKSNDPMAPVIALQLGAMEQYSNALGMRIAALERP